MASKELANEFVNALGDYYRVNLAKFFRGYGGEGDFITDLIVIKQQYDFASDTELAENAMKKFDQDFGGVCEAELVNIVFDASLRPAYALSIFPDIFAEHDYDVPFSIVVGQENDTKLDEEAYLFALKEFDDEKLKEAIRNVQLETWRA